MASQYWRGMGISLVPELFPVQPISPNFTLLIRFSVQIRAKFSLSHHRICIKTKSNPKIVLAKGILEPGLLRCNETNQISFRTTNFLFGDKYQPVLCLVLFEIHRNTTISSVAIRIHWVSFGFDPCRNFQFQDVHQLHEFRWVTWNGCWQSLWCNLIEIEFKFWNHNFNFPKIG